MDWDQYFYLSAVTREQFFSFPFYYDYNYDIVIIIVKWKTKKLNIVYDHDGKICLRWYLAGDNH